MIAALWSNSNWDDTKGTRQNTINRLMAQHEAAVEAIEAALRSARKPVKEEEKLSENNPFFAATERGLEKIEIAYEKSGRKLKKPEDEIDYMHGLDQADG